MDFKKCDECGKEIPQEKRLIIVSAYGREFGTLTVDFCCFSCLTNWSERKERKYGPLGQPEESDTPAPGEPTEV